MRPEDVRQRLLRCDGVADGDLAELAISLILDRVTIELLVSRSSWALYSTFVINWGSWVQEMSLSQALDLPLLYPMCLVGIEHL